MSGHNTPHTSFIYHQQSQSNTNEIMRATFPLAVALSAFVGLTVASPPGGYGGHGGGEESYGPPQPYEFSYTAEDPEGSHGHSQTFDGNMVRGHYMIQLADGTMRKVEYHADENGFHAKIVTNELGTESKNPADAIFESSAPTGEEAARQHGAGGAAEQHHGKGGAKASNNGWN
ncbi:glutamate receptor [Tropilaelaps mercedesae]|uniref:Glutamate receptor n=1 Tax=Tropilaelaps mercedesae TaxID=418985 RepID=A0A1V9XRU7_9ACAR|nr:glutamate receptor [Tropilaelaps mercedesae]